MNTLFQIEITEKSTFKNEGIEFISALYTISFIELEYISQIHSEICKVNLYMETGISNRQVLIC